MPDNNVKHLTYLLGWLLSCAVVGVVVVCLVSAFLSQQLGNVAAQAKGLNEKLSVKPADVQATTEAMGGKIMKELGQLRDVVDSRTPLLEELEMLREDIVQNASDRVYRKEVEAWIEIGNERGLSLPTLDEAAARAYKKGANIGSTGTPVKIN